MMRGRGRAEARCFRQRVAFTLMEVLLVLAAIGLITTVMVVGGTRVLRSDDLSPEQILWKAVEEARRFALLHQCEVRVSYDSETQSFRAITPLGTETFPVPFDGELQIDFLSAQKAGRSILIGGRLVETEPLTGVSFFEDGTCTPFRVQLRVNNGEAQTIEIDPWTCAPVLARKAAP